MRANYDTLTLKLQDGLDQYERYSEQHKEAAFFKELVSEPCLCLCLCLWRALARPWVLLCRWVQADEIRLEGPNWIGFATSVPQQSRKDQVVRDEDNHWGTGARLGRVKSLRQQCPPLLCSHGDSPVQLQLGLKFDVHSQWQLWLIAPLILPVLRATNESN